MKLQVIKTTDKKYLGKIFEVDALTDGAEETAFGRIFGFTEMQQINPTTVRLLNTNFSATLKILEA